MQIRTLALSGAAIVAVGAALAGGYYYGQSRQQPPSQPVAQAPAQNTYADQQQPPPESSSSESSSPMPRGYESAQFSAAPRFGSSRHRHGARHPVDYAYFHDQLARYGRWQYSDRWGQVWQPSYVDADFRPYDRGHWVNTQEFGWTWDSDYEWGSIPFHYGRWVDDPERGWLWIPGYVWGPGWVVWRSNGHYTGWMPMPPDRDFLRGDETYRNDWREQADYGYREWYGPQYDENRTASLWVFVDTGHMADRDYHRYQVTQPQEVKQVLSQTTNVTNYTTVNNYVVNQSIDVRAVEQASGHKVEAVPATAVVKKPELVIPVSEGKQAQIEARQEVPTGLGKPNSAPAPTQPSGAAAPGGPSQQQAGAKSAQSAPSGPQTTLNALPPSQTANSGTSSSQEKPAKAAKQEGEPKAANAGGPMNAQTGMQGTPPQAAREEKRHRAFERELGLSQASPKEGGAPVSNGLSGTSENAQSARETISEAKRHRSFEREQGLSQVPPNGGGSSAANGPSGASEGGQSSAPQSMGELKRHRPPFEREQGMTQATPKEIPPGRSDNAGPPTANGPNTEPNAVGSNESPAPSRRHRGVPPWATQPNGSQGSEATNAQPSQGSGFPRGAENAVAPNTDNGPTPGEPPRKRKMVVPAATEPGASSQRGSQNEPGSDVRTQSPPSESGASEENPKPHKGRHKSDEPGGDNEPPSP